MQDLHGPTHAATIGVAQEIIDFIEDCLLEKLSPTTVAEHFYISVASASAVFKIAFDMTIMEYVRHRRLSCAGQELLTSRVRVIDLAYKYGYETPEAFTKAFTRFHGVPPGVVRRLYPQIRYFHPLVLSVQVTGGFGELTKTDCERRDECEGIGYHDVIRKKGGNVMLPEINRFNLRLADRNEQEDWNHLLALSRELDDAGIAHKVDGKTMIFAHGLEFALEKICLTFQWDDQELVKTYFGYAGEIHSTAYPGFRYFDLMRGGKMVRCMFFEGDSLYRNTDIVNVDGQALYVQSLEFYLENAEPRDAFYEMVEQHLNRKT